MSWALVVDDDEDIREALGLALATDGIRMVGVADGAQALETMQRLGPPAVILLDLMMPGMSGAELARRLRADPALARIPLIVLSGDSLAAQAAAKIGAAAVYTKPVEIDELLRTLRRFSA